MFNIKILQLYLIIKILPGTKNRDQDVIHYIREHFCKKYIDQYYEKTILQFDDWDCPRCHTKNIHGATTKCPHCEESDSVVTFRPADTRCAVVLTNSPSWNDPEFHHQQMMHHPHQHHHHHHHQGGGGVVGAPINTNGNI